MDLLRLGAFQALRLQIASFCALWRVRAAAIFWDWFQGKCRLVLRARTFRSCTPRHQTTSATNPPITLDTPQVPNEFEF